MTKIMTQERVEKGEVLCGICHKSINAGQEWDFHPISQVDKFTSQAIVAHTSCVEKEEL